MRIAFIQIGIGTVGGAVIEQALANRDRWQRELGLDVRIGALMGRDGALIGEEGDLSDDLLRKAVVARREGTPLGEFARGRPASDMPHAVLERFAAAGPTVVLDAATGGDTAALNARALELGARVVFSNKAPLAMPLGNPISAALWKSAG